MKKTLTAVVAAAIIAGTLAMSATDASAQWRRGWGWGPGLAAGIIGGAIITGAIMASRPRGYVVYEGYGPSGVAVIVEALTDNRNRTAGDVRHTFARNDGNLGGSGAVSWLFERRGVVLVEADGADEDELTLAAAEGGAEDVSLDGTSFQVTSAPEDLSAVREAIEAAGFSVDSAELTMVPKTTVEVADEGEAKKILRLIDQLEENDDVQDVYANFDIPEQVLEAVAS